MIEPTMNQYAAPKAHVEDVGAGPGVGELKLFSAQGRIGRLRYLAYVTGASFVQGIGTSVLTIGLKGSTLAVIIAIAAYAALLWFGIICAIKRCHDMGISGWWTLTAFIPIIGFAWFFWPGSKDANRFGPPPPPNTWGVRILGLLMPLFFIIGILAAVAIPQYKDFTDRAKARAAQQQQQQPAGQQ